VAITNTGKSAGKEVAQLYVEAPESKLDKPSHELKAFVKTKLLQPGETQVVELKLKLDDLSSFDESIDAWVTDAGTYKFIVSSSSRDPKGVVSMNINQSVRKVENVMNVPNRFAKKKIGIL
jgi:beta-glucosidase